MRQQEVIVPFWESAADGSVSGWRNHAVPIEEAKAAAVSIIRQIEEINGEGVGWLIQELNAHLPAQMASALEIEKLEREQPQAVSPAGRLRVFAG